MNGLQLSKSLFDETGLPLLKRTCPEALDRLAAGLSGGSQCHGHDDAVSRDHGWGPSFAVWLPVDSFGSHAPKIRAALAAGLPAEYAGFANVACTVMEFDQYVREVVGVSEAPGDPYEWLRIPEEALFEITHRPVFYDPSGFASARFQSFATYPEDVWKKRLEACLFWLWEWGVKHLKRAELRDDRLAAAWYWMHFAEHAARTAFLLERSYAPYHKWLFRMAAELSPSNAMVVRMIIDASSEERRYNSAASISRLILERLRELGIPEIEEDDRSPVAYPDLPEIHMYRRGLISSIKDERIKAVPAGQSVILPPTKGTTTWFRPAQ